MATSAFVAPTPLPSTAVAPRAHRRRRLLPSACASRPSVTVLDYGAGNVRSLENALRLFDCHIRWANTASDISNASKLIFPGVGSFGAAMENLHDRGFVTALKRYIQDDRPFLGICLGLHTLFEGSEESPQIPGLALFPGMVRRFSVDHTQGLAVPHIGWNTVDVQSPMPLLQRDSNHHSSPSRFYFVHSYRIGTDVLQSLHNTNVATTTHGEPYLSILQRGQICATQFHPEKSGPDGLRLIRNFLYSGNPSSKSTEPTRSSTVTIPLSSPAASKARQSGLAKRIVACLDVRENDDGDLVVTKGDQYDVRHTDSKQVRNLGKPVELAKRYFEEGADEICFLNITSFRGEPVGSAPMIQVLEHTSKEVFVPLCIGGGIRDYTDRNGTHYSALDVASMYFRAGADKVSLGSDAVYAAERFLKQGADGTSSIERISYVYGAQAVVVSVDPQRVYVENHSDTPFTTVTLPDGRVCWYQCTVKGGREGRNIDVVQLVTAAEKLGAGEILLNSMDQDGQNNGYDLQLIDMVRKAVSIPVIASSGAGKPQHFTECFDATDVEAALAAGIFHRKEVSIGDVKQHMLEHGTVVRISGSLDEVVERSVGVESEVIQT
ncbi:Imidazole glycerol phosphate synthase hisHF, chloroplastic [Gracilariopsis chorda]|uniref:Imidazole glycerol phosphate synthase hisHF n=1 Tax=Gracilariopsis chorda TaxID=448386 RepID=A0A2V3IY62_9FLOR|nr:Imidazole glycerol phosphate synthase hisHF, chloroplastic [Gracilariopsis chorda]|eukprot:PXF47003.1 Imidazole glycerol phosphate synthase hisHF, chloroplastic [Gracilariopsis chorda]